MMETVVIDKTVLRELTEHNKVAKNTGFNNNGKIHFLTTLHNVHYACTWACPTDFINIDFVFMIVYLSDFIKLRMLFMYNFT